MLIAVLGFIIMSHIKRYLPGVLQHFLQDKSQMLLDPNILKAVRFNRIDAVWSYLILGRDPNEKASRVVGSVENYIKRSEKELMERIQVEQQEGESLTVLVSRLLMLTSFNRHNQALIRSIQQYYLLADQRYFYDLLLALRIVSSNGGLNDQFTQTIKDSIQEYLDTKKVALYPYRYFTILNSIPLNGNSVLFIHFYHSLAKKIDQYLEIYDNHIAEQGLEVKYPKSTKLLMRLALRQNCLIKKRLIYETILAKMNKAGHYQNQTIPGLACTDSSQLLDKYSFFKTLTQNQQFIDFFALAQQHTQFANTPERPLEVILYIDRLYHFIERGGFKLSGQQINQIINKLKQFWSNQMMAKVLSSEPKLLRQPNQQDQIEISDENGEFIFKYIISLGFLNASCLCNKQVNKQDLTQITRTFAKLIQQKRYHQYLVIGLRKSPKTLINFLLFQCLAHMLAQQSQQKVFYKPLLQIEAIKTLANLQNIKRGGLRLRPFLSYAALMALRKYRDMKQFTKVLSFSQPDQYQLMRFIEINQEHNQKVPLDIITSLPLLNEKYLFLKNVLIQPNLSFTFCFIDKKSKLPVACFEGPQNNQSRYEFSQQVQKFLDQSQDLNVRGIWKRQFLKNIYNCKFFCSRNEIELSYKICSFIYQNCCKDKILST